MKKTPPVCTWVIKYSSKLIFASCVWYFFWSRYVTMVDIPSSFPLVVTYAFRFLGGQNTSNFHRLVGNSFYTAARNVIGCYLASLRWKASEGKPCVRYIWSLRGNLNLPFHSRPGSWLYNQWDTYSLACWCHPYFGLPDNTSILY